MREQVFLLFTPIVASIIAAAFLIVWQRNAARRENLAQSIGWCLVAIGFLISQITPPEYGRAPIPVTHVFYTLGSAALGWGILHRIEIAAPLRSWLAIALISLLAIAASQSVAGNIATDIYLSNTACGLIMITCAQLFAQRASHDLVDRLLMWSLVLVVAQFFLRPALTMMVDGPIASATYRDTVYYNALHTTLSIGSLFFGAALFAAAIKDLFADERHRTSRDALSGLLVRGEFEERVDTALAKAANEGRDVALVIGDIDHFKQVNDIWGHQVGDSAIAAFGAMTARMIRSSDIAGRIGGEEFCILVWNADEDVAAGLAERLRRRTNDLDISKGALDVRLTASFGVAQRQGNESYRALFAKADRALYQAKQGGRDRVVRASEGDLPESYRTAQKPDASGVAA